MLQLIKKLQDKKGSLFFQFLFWVFLPFLLVVTLIPTDLISSGSKSWLPKLQFKNEDKVVHFTLFFIFTFLLAFSNYFKKSIYLFILPFFLGLLIEILQYVMNMGRSFDVFDILANTFGIATALLLFQKYFK